MRRLYALLTLLAAFGLVFAVPLARAAEAPGEPLETIVARLVDEALGANLELEAAGASVAERLAVLDQARARYLPALDLAARYSRADGGRKIDIPVGDLLNPVYSTLNGLTGSSRFPSIANQQVPFLRSREQDTHLSLTQPLYDARLPAAIAAAAADYAGAGLGRAALQGRIARDLRIGYYRWLEAHARIAILEATLELARENRRVNDSLYRNGKTTRDLLYRAEADLLEVEQSRLAAGNAEQLARGYVNLLCNARLDRELPPAVVGDPALERLQEALARRAGAPGLALPELQTVAVERRPELKQLEAASAAAEAAEHLARAAFRPQLALAVDAGTQGERYGLGSDDRYAIASLVLKFNFYSGGADAAGVAGARAAGRAARANRSLAEQRIRLEVEQAYDDLKVASSSLDTAAKRVDAAAGAFRIAARKRDLGQINQAEFIDARRALTDAELNLNLTRFEALGSVAELEYALGAATQRPSPESRP